MNAHVEHPAAYADAIKRNIIANARKTFISQNPDAGEVIQYLWEAGNWSEFARNLTDAYEKYGKLTPNQLNAARSMLAKSKARKAEKDGARIAHNAAQAAKSSHIGTIKAREVFTLKLCKIIAIEGIYGTSYLHICEDVNGNAIVYKGTSNIGEEGQTVTVKATIKDHTIYNGIPQTVIARPVKQ